MKPISIGLRLFLLALACGGMVQGKDLEALSKSPVWQVRYCAALEFDTASPVGRGCLERLCRDKEPRVASQAFHRYASLFVTLDRQLVQAAFARGDFNVAAIDVAGKPQFDEPSFWITRLKSLDDDNNRADVVHTLGLCGSASDVPVLVPLLTSRNPYLLTELALAFHRLGDPEKYMAALDALLNLPIQENLYYQNLAIDYLLQTHPDRAREAWQKLEMKIKSTYGIQPKPIYLHYLQEERLR